MRAHSTIDHHQPHHLGRMPRPAKKKPGTRTTLAKEYDDHTSRRQVQGQNRRRGAFRGESPDKRAVRSTHHSTENFERRCLDVFESMKDEIESKFKSHEAHLAQLYRSVEEINDEVESPETELSFERMVQEDFDTEINYLSKVLTNLSSSSHPEGPNHDAYGSQMISQILEDLSSRPEQLFEFSQRMTDECKRGFRIYCKANKLVADSQQFKEKYKALMEEVL